MIRNVKIALTAVALTLLLMGQAHALTLTNRDTVEQRLQISEGDDVSVTQDIMIGSDQTLDALCEAGCVLTLDNGVQERFEGNEIVYIEDGRFVIAQ